MLLEGQNKMTWLIFSQMVELFEPTPDHYSMK